MHPSDSEDFDTNELHSNGEDLHEIGKYQLDVNFTNENIPYSYDLNDYKIEAWFYYIYWADLISVCTDLNHVYASYACLWVLTCRIMGR